MSGSLRADVRSSVAGLDPVDDRERRGIAEVLAGLDDLAAPFDMASDPTHVTGSALVVSELGMVLLRHKRLGIWLQPGGHIDPGETPWEAAAREAEEETGLAVRAPEAGPLLLHVDAHDGGRGHRHLDLRYVLRAAPVRPDPPAEESQACAWFSFDAAARVADEGLRGVIPRLRTMVRTILPDARGR